jgi:regulatory protein
VDRGRFASLPAASLVGLDLVVGQEIGPLALERLQEHADREAAHRAALRALARRAHARFDLRRRLLQTQHPPAAVDAALDRLSAVGLLDDERFATEYARAKARRGRGPARLVRDLQSQGVERRVAEDAVRQSLAAEGVDTADVARALAAKRARQLAGLAPAVRKRRLSAFLARRGFAAHEIWEVVESLNS